MENEIDNTEENSEINNEEEIAKTLKTEFNYQDGTPYELS
jgi:hypothetical protein